MQMVGTEDDNSLEFRQTDMNDDGEIDLFDLLAVVDQSVSETAVKETEPEFVAAVTWMGASDDGSPEFEQNDVNGDGVIDLFDLLDIVEHQPADL